MEKLIKYAIIKTYCLRNYCQDTPKRAQVHAEEGAVSINTKVKSEDTEITDTRNLDIFGRLVSPHPEINIGPGCIKISHRKHMKRN